MKSLVELLNESTFIPADYESISASLNLFLDSVLKNKKYDIPEEDYRGGAILSIPGEELSKDISEISYKNFRIPDFKKLLKPVLDKMNEFGYEYVIRKEKPNSVRDRSPYPEDRIFFDGSVFVLFYPKGSMWDYSNRLDIIFRFGQDENISKLDIKIGKNIYDEFSR